MGLHQSAWYVQATRPISFTGAWPQRTTHQHTGEQGQKARYVGAASAEAIACCPCTIRPSSEAASHIHTTQPSGATQTSIAASRNSPPADQIFLEDVFKHIRRDILSAACQMTDSEVRSPAPRGAGNLLEVVQQLEIFFPSHNFEHVRMRQTLTVSN